MFARQDKTSPRGRRVYEVWEQTGRCPPEVLTETEREVGAEGK